MAAIEYDPNRNARIALLHYADGEKAYILAPRGVKVGDRLESGPRSDIRPGNALPLRNIPAGTSVHAIELRPGGGAKLARSAGAGRPADVEGEQMALLRASLRGDADGSARLPGHDRSVGNAEAELIKVGKAGRNRWKGVRPQTRGVAMNPVDHPLGGGEGKSSGGRHPVSPWGKPEGRTRKKKQVKQRTDRSRRRSTGGRR